jgi:hypothetical protein
MGEMLIDLFFTDPYLLGKIDGRHFPVHQGVDQSLSNRLHYPFPSFPIRRRESLFQCSLGGPRGEQEITEQVEYVG